MLPPPATATVDPRLDIDSWVRQQPKRDLLRMLHSACGCLRSAWLEFAALKGISTATSIVDLKTYGYQGFLVGENFMKTENPGASAAAFIKTIEDEV